MSIALLSTALVALMIARMVLTRPRVLARAAIEGAEVIVREHDGAREMIARHRRTMVWARVRGATSDLVYVDPCLIPRDARRVLFLGCGAAVGPRLLAERSPEIDIDIVESEPAVVALAETFFGLRPGPRMRVHLADAAEFVRTSERWDAVFVDLYGADELPAAVSSTVFLRNVARVADRVVINVVDRLDGRTLSRLVDAIEASGASCTLIPLQKASDRRRNVLLVVHPYQSGNLS